jgi:hypothetical protein
VPNNVSSSYERFELYIAPVSFWLSGDWSRTPEEIRKKLIQETKERDEKERLERLEKEEEQVSGGMVNNTGGKIRGQAIKWSIGQRPYGTFDVTAYNESETMKIRPNGVYALRASSVDPVTKQPLEAQIFIVRILGDTKTVRHVMRFLEEEDAVEKVQQKFKLNNFWFIVTGEDLLNYHFKVRAKHEGVPRLDKIKLGTETDDLSENGKKYQMFKNYLLYYSNTGITAEYATQGAIKMRELPAFIEKLKQQTGQTPDKWIVSELKKKTSSGKKK